MEPSILKSTKKTLGLDEDYTAFDHDILVYINSALSTLHQLGLGPEGYQITGEDEEWSELGLAPSELGHVKAWVALKCRMLFDPPTMSFLIEAVEKQISEHEWRISNLRKSTTDPFYKSPIVVETEVIP